MNKAKTRLSYSKISCFMKCRREYYWRYIENLTPIQKADYFQIGIVVHDLREKWIKNELEVTDIEKLKEYISKQFPSNDPETSQRVALEAATLFVGYVKDMDRSPYELISPEMHIELELEEFTLYARLDALAKDDRGNVLRDELKTTSRMDSAYLAGLSKGLQTGITFWIIDETMREHNVKGSLFEIIVKTKIPQYARHPIMKDRFTVDYTKQCVHGVWESIKRCGTDRKNFYPSMQCSYGKYTCAYETLCRNDTPMKRKTLFTEYYPTKGGESEKESKAAPATAAARRKNK